MSRIINAIANTLLGQPRYRVTYAYRLDGTGVVFRLSATASVKEKSMMADDRALKVAYGPLWNRVELRPYLCNGGLSIESVSYLGRWKG